MAPIGLKIPREHAELGNLVVVDDSLMDTVLSMHEIVYRIDNKVYGVATNRLRKKSQPSIS